MTYNTKTVEEDTRSLNKLELQARLQAVGEPTIVTDDTHIRISKRVYRKFRRVGVYGESADDILDSLIDFYLENKDKPGVGDRRIQEEEGEGEEEEND